MFLSPPLHEFGTFPFSESKRCGFESSKFLWKKKAEEQIIVIQLREEPCEHNIFYIN